MLIAVSKLLKARLLHTNSELEAVTLKVGQDLIVCCLYIPPDCSQDYFDRVLLFLKNLPLGNHNIVVTGDFNLPDINWECMAGPGARSEQFCDVIVELNLVQLVHNPTHRLGNTLDLVFSNCPELVKGTWVDDRTPSDHFLVNFTVQYSFHHPSLTVSRCIPCYSRADLLGLDNYLMDTDFSVLEAIQNIDDLYSYFSSAISSASQYFIPTVVVPNNPSPPWFNSDIRHILNKIHSLRRSLKRKSTTCIGQENKMARLEEELAAKIASSKERYLLGLVNDFCHNPTKLYRYLRMIAQKPVNSIFEGVRGEILQDPQGISEAFNVFFNSTFSNSDYTLPPMLPSPAEQLHDVSISASDTFEALSKLDSSKAMGCDLISPKVLKSCASLWHYFSTIFCSLVSCLIPGDVTKLLQF